MKEIDVEEKLVAEVKKHGGICPKWVSPGYDGVPDRIVLMPGGIIGFVEVKALGKNPRPLQKARMRTLRDLGFRTFVLDNPEQIEDLILELKGDNT